MSPSIDVLLTLGSFSLIFCLALAIRIGFRRRGGR
jgi:hypothetical protein